MYLIFDTETTEVTKEAFKDAITDTTNWPRCIQIAWQLTIWETHRGSIFGENQKALIFRMMRNEFTVFLVLEAEGVSLAEKY
jgi:hypothetical protein